MMRRIACWPGPGLCAVLLLSCSDDPVTTAPPPPPPPEETDTADRAALIAFYHSTNGRTHWHEKRNWNTPESIRTWQGVTTNSAGFVTELALPGNNLSGPLPPELGDLAQLKRLSLYSNKLTGPIPPELGKLGQHLPSRVDTVVSVDVMESAGAIPANRFPPIGFRPESGACGGSESLAGVAPRPAADSSATPSWPLSSLRVRRAP